MPKNPNYEKDSRVDLMYKKYPTGYPTYEELRADLATINSAILNEEANISLNNNYDSYTTANRKRNEVAGIPKKYNKKRLYGIVVGNSEDIGKNVYVDVPLQNINVIKDDLIFLNSEVDLQNYQELIFFPMINFFQTTPPNGAICVVLVPENYPNHVDTNSEDAVYIDLYRKEILAPAGANRPEVKVLPGSIQDQINQIRARGVNLSYSRGSYGNNNTFGSGGATAGGDVTLKECTPEDAAGVFKGKKVLLMGDSHTVGKYGTYLEEFINKLGAAKVTVSAKIGISAQSFYASVNSEYLNKARAAKPIDIMILTIGTNDAANSNYPDNPSGVISDFFKNVDRLFDTVDPYEAAIWVGLPSFEDGGAKTYAGNKSLNPELMTAKGNKGVDLNKRAEEIWTQGKSKYGILAIDPRQVTKSFADSSPRKNDIHIQQDEGNRVWAEFVVKQVQNIICTKKSGKSSGGPSDAPPAEKLPETDLEKAIYVIKQQYPEGVIRDQEIAAVTRNADYAKGYAAKYKPPG